MVRFIPTGVRRAFINAPGTSAVWLADDDDGDGVFDFRQVLGPDDGLELPVDMIMSYDGADLYVTNWFGNTVQQFDISDPFNPTLRATVTVPHPNMLRLSRGRQPPVRLQLAAHAMGQRPRLRRPAQQRLRDLAVRRRLGQAASTALHADGSAVGQLRQRRQADDHRPGRSAHDAVRPERQLDAGEH